MPRYFVLYDETCELCGLCRNWVERQPQIVPLTFVPAGAQATRDHFSDLSLPVVPDELIVVSDEGHVYRDSAAWITILWALEDYRNMAHRLSSPHRRAIAGRIVKSLATHRSALSRLVSMFREPRCLPGDDECRADLLNLVETDEW